MIVPTYWAEARLQEKTPERQVTVRRFGWSDASQADAQALADERAREALARILAGESKVARRDEKIPYGGADGMPIREEIVERAGEMVVTRNSYGARCLNVPDVLFADIDQGVPRGGQFGCWLAFALSASALYFTRSWTHFERVALVVAACFATWAVVRAVERWQIRRLARQGDRVPQILRDFAASNPEWHLRLYRTPAGWRVLAMQRTFEPREPAVAEAFQAWGVDPVYAMMCWNQQCFRARLTAKPWRIGLTEHLRPRPGVWPINPERMPDRLRWVAEYENAAREFAACRFVEAIGSSNTTAKTESVRAAHDRWCAAESDLPLA
ncbi:MAG TPA: hypothetical protein VGO11_23715 [Chthoniobacteraceae bacterium]|jgi:hypothetical protein|nr:hypothetical protein [Chthoniobacteraceae bacterium]